MRLNQSILQYINAKQILRVNSKCQILKQNSPPTAADLQDALTLKRMRAKLFQCLD